MASSDAPYGLMAQFASAEALGDAVGRARQAGYTRIDAYSPIALSGVAEKVGGTGRTVGVVAVLCGMASAMFWYALQDYSLYDYPFIEGGKPFHAWPPFMVVTFMTGVLAAVLVAVIAMLAINGLPMFHHPVFNVATFAKCSTDGYFLCVRADDPRFDVARTKDFLLGLPAVEVVEVPE